LLLPEKFMSDFHKIVQFFSDFPLNVCRRVENRLR
jgi:hypothetical protein